MNDFVTYFWGKQVDLDKKNDDVDSQFFHQFDELALEEPVIFTMAEISKQGHEKTAVYRPFNDHFACG